MIARLALLASLLAAPLAAQDFSAGFEAKSWNLYAEKPARFVATVVDPLCPLTGDCPDDCGQGKRQLALLRGADDVLVYPLKNNQPLFTGAANELAPFCGQTVEVDGLMLEDEDLALKNVYQVQKLRLVGDEAWITANRWLKDWEATNPKGKGPWFRRDPRIIQDIATNGYFGLGLEVDAAVIKELFP